MRMAMCQPFIPKPYSISCAFQGEEEVLRYLKITLSSTVDSQLGGRLPEESHFRIVVAELKFVVPVTCSSCDNNNNYNNG